MHQQERCIAGANRGDTANKVGSSTLAGARDRAFGTCAAATLGIAAGCCRCCESWLLTFGSIALLLRAALMLLLEADMLLTAAVAAAAAADAVTVAELLLPKTGTAPGGNAGNKLLPSSTATPSSSSSSSPAKPMPPVLLSDNSLLLQARDRLDLMLVACLRDCLLPGDDAEGDGRYPCWCLYSNACTFGSLLLLLLLSNGIESLAMAAAMPCLSPAAAVLLCWQLPALLLLSTGDMSGSGVVCDRLHSLLLLLPALLAYTQNRNVVPW
jgi:hypothetical protein